MRQLGIGLVGLVAFFAQMLSVPGESTLDALNSALDDIKKQHQDVVAQNMANFLSQLDTAASSPDAALDLYQKAGGTMPSPTPITKLHENETPDEKAAREAQDQANAANLAYVAQLHCALMRYAALLVTSPDQKGLNEAWITWLKSAAPVYAQIKSSPPTPNAGAGGQRANWGQNKSEMLVNDLKNKPVGSSNISDYLGFHGWSDGGQSGWSVKQLPELYRSMVLEPLRATPSADTLAAWDVFIGMKAADQPDSDQWNQVELPSLMFDKDCDDYAISHSMDKLQVLLEIIQANPDHPKLDDMIARAHQLVDDYRSRHSVSTPSPQVSTPSSTAGPPPSNVTTVTQGDMTIITTQTNGPPVAPPAPITPAH